MLIFAVHNLGDTALFRCAGRFVSGEEENLQKAVLSQSRARTVVVDLAEVGTIDAGGIGVLVSLRGSAQSKGIGFKLMNLNPRVEEVLELTHLREFFEVCSVREMLELLCHAVRQSRSEAPASIGLPGEFVESKVAEQEIVPAFLAQAS
jgi:anti-anti-sigma factor